MQLPTPRARPTDPYTSHDAAGSVTDSTITRTQQSILDILAAYGPAVDPAIYDRMVKLHGPGFCSQSGARTRRAELVDAGKVKDSGRTTVLPSGRRAVVWEAVCM